MNRGIPESVCLVLPWSFTLNGGVNQVVHNLIRELQKTDSCRPIALELQWNPSVTKDFLPGSTTPRLQLRLHSPYIAQKPLKSILAFLLFAPRELFALRRLVKDYSIKAFNLHFPDLVALNFLLLRLCGLFAGRVVLSFHGSDIRTAYQQKGPARLLWRFILRHASAVVTPSRALAEEVRMVEPQAHTLTIYNGIDIAYFAANSGSGFQWPAGLAGKRVLVNIAGKFQYGKGHDILVRAFEQIADRYPDVCLVLVGAKGPTSATVRELVAATRLSSRVYVFEDLPHSNMYDILTRGELFVSASRWRKGIMGEAFAPLVVLEAAAAKLPVVATATCGVNELIRDRENGRIVELENPAALANAIAEMLDDPAGAQRMAEELYVTVDRSFRWTHAASQYRKVCCCGAGAAS